MFPNEAENYPLKIKRIVLEFCPYMAHICSFVGDSVFGSSQRSGIVETLVFLYGHPSLQLFSILPLIPRLQSNC